MCISLISKRSLRHIFYINCLEGQVNVSMVQIVTLRKDQQVTIILKHLSLVESENKNKQNILKLNDDQKDDKVLAAL